MPQVRCYVERGVLPDRLQDSLSNADGRAIEEAVGTDFQPVSLRRMRDCFTLR